MITVLISPTATALSSEIEQAGLRLLTWPKLDVGEPVNSSLLDEAIANLFGYDWLIVKNIRAAEHFLRRLERLSSLSALDDLRVLSIGETTNAKLIESHVHVDVSLNRFRFKEVFPALNSFVAEPSLARLNFLIPCANIVTEIFELQLEEASARADRVTAYQSTGEALALTRLNALLAGGGIDFIAFRQPAEVEEFAQLFDTDDLGRLLSNVSLACADNETREAAQQFGLTQTTFTPEVSTLMASIGPNRS